MTSVRLLRQTLAVCCLLLALALPALAGPVSTQGENVGLHGQKVAAAERKGVLDELRSHRFASEKEAEITLRKMGVVTAGPTPLTLYVWVADLPPACPGCAEHEAKRLLVFREGEYLGYYTITEFPLRLKGNVLEFPRDDLPSGDWGFKIVFGPEGPPSHIYLLGETHDFAK